MTTAPFPLSHAHKIKTKNTLKFLFANTERARKAKSEAERAPGNQGRETESCYLQFQ